MTLKNGLSKCSLCVISVNGWKDQYMASSRVFPPKKTLIWRRHCSFANRVAVWRQSEESIDVCVITERILARWLVESHGQWEYRPWKLRNMSRVIFRETSLETKTKGANHSSNIQTGPTGKSGPPQKVDQFFRNFSGGTQPIHWVLDRNLRKFWLNGLRPKCYCKKQFDHNMIFHGLHSYDTLKCSKLCSETTCLRLVVLLEFWTFYDVISMVYKSVDHGKLWSIC